MDCHAIEPTKQPLQWRGIALLTGLAIGLGLLLIAPAFTSGQSLLPKQTTAPAPLPDATPPHPPSSTAGTPARPLQAADASSPAGNQTPAAAVSDLSFKNEQESRVLMLHHGAIFQGQIRKQDRGWVVQIDPQTSMTFENYRVAAVADSLQDLYFFRDQRIPAGNVAARVELAHWCLKHTLIDEADSCVQHIQKLNVDPSIVQTLQRKIQQLRDPAADAATRSAPHAGLAGHREKPLPTNWLNTQSAPPARTSPASLTQAPASLTQAPASLTQAPDSATRLTAPGPQGTNLASGKRINRQSSGDTLLSPVAAPTDPNSTQAEVPELVDSVFSFYDKPGFRNEGEIKESIDNRLSQGAIQQFSESVNTTLVNACAGCHFPGNAMVPKTVKFELEMVASSGDPSQWLRHNLQQTLSLVNRQNPGNSELLSIISQPHGGLPTAPLGQGSPEFETVSAWAFQTQLEQVPPGSESESRVVVASATQPMDAAPDAGGPIWPHASEHDSDFPQGGAAFPQDLNPLGSTPPVDPQKPHDAGAFNRHYHPQAHRQPEPRRQPSTPVVSAPLSAGQPPSALAPAAGQLTPRPIAEETLPETAANALPKTAAETNANPEVGSAATPAATKPAAPATAPAAAPNWPGLRLPRLIQSQNGETQLIPAKEK